MVVSNKTVLHFSPDLPPSPTYMNDPRQHKPKVERREQTLLQILVLFGGLGEGGREEGREGEKKDEVVAIYSGICSVWTDS